MLKISFILFLISFIAFTGIMVHDPRTLWSGFSFFLMSVCLAFFSFFLLSQYAEQLASHDMVIGILIALFIATTVCVLVFPGLLIAVFFIEGIKVIRHEGAKLSNLLSMFFSLMLFSYLVVWPQIGNLTKHTLGTMLYIIVSFSAIYLLSLMSMYSLSAILNLVHLKKNRNADYIVVLGAGIIGTRVTPLLAARIDRGIALLYCNPNAVLIMSGGQGSGEDISESEAMAAYAVEKGVNREKIIIESKSVSTQENLLFSRELMDKEKPEIIIVTTSYHVLRALLRARQQRMKCVGFGAKTKWYFTLNALIREFIGYLHLTWKKHAFVIGAVTSIIVTTKVIVWLK